MRRTQLYLVDDLWQLLRVLSRQSKSSVSDLVRQAIREKYMNGSANRKQALEAFVGIWKDRKDLPETDSYVRALRTS